MTHDDLEKYIETLKANRLRLQQLRTIAEERAKSLTERMNEIEVEMGKRAPSVNGYAEQNCEVRSDA